MLFALFCTTAILTASDATESADLEAAREAGAEVLWSTLERAGSRQEDAARWSLLLKAGETATVALEDSALGDQVRSLLAEARATKEPTSEAADTLEAGLTGILADLEFEPILEAALPEGFPAPTPVGEIALKRYPLYRLARADSAGGSGAFWQLFSHIQKHDIPMTAPVEMTYDAAGDEVEMAFMYEHSRQGDVGRDGAVEVVDVPPMFVASIGCRGWSSESAVDQATARLTTWLATRDDLEVTGRMRRLGYNGPSVRGDRRYFEVQIPVRRVAVDGSGTSVDGEDGSRGRRMQ